MSNSLINSAYVGLIAANQIIVSKYSRHPPPVFGRIPARYAPPGLHHTVRLLDPSLDEEGGFEQRLSRAAGAAAMHAYEARRDGVRHALQPSTTGVTQQLLSAGELKRLREREEHVQPRRSAAQRRPKARAPSPTEREDPGLGQMCRYCTMFQELLHEFQDVPMVVLNHGARIQADFDPEKNISEAKIDDFQLLLPQEEARKALERCHPLTWRVTAPDMFQEVAAAAPTKRARRFEPVTGDPFRFWGGSGTDEVFLYERAVMPWNEEVSPSVENILSIRAFANVLVPTEEIAAHFKRGGSRAHNPGSTVVDRIRKAVQPSIGEHPHALRSALRRAPWSKEETRVLAYRYSLAQCLRSSYGIGSEENGGLDIDDGIFSGSAVHYSKLSADLVGNLTRDDLNHLRGALQLHYRRPNGELEDAAKRAIGYLDGAEKAAQDPAKAQEDLGKLIGNVAEQLKILWNGEDPWLLTISSKKRLRYTFPRNAPANLWQLLTWITPAFLFTFINRSVCQLPHVLMQERNEKRSKQAKA